MNNKKKKKQSNNRVNSRMKQASTPTRRKMRKRPAGENTGSGLALSPVGRCTQLFASALLNPFDTPGGVCLPHSPFLASAKTKNRARGTVVIGTNGVGFIAAGMNIANNASLAGNNASVYFSAATYTGLSINTIGGSVGVTAVNYGSSYASAPLSDGTIQTRVSAFGCRVRYIGTTLGMNGRAVAFEHPYHEAVDGLTESNMFLFAETESVPVGRGWIAANWQPRLTTEYQYRDHDTRQLQPDVGILITGTAGDKFEFEATIHYEVVGKVAVGVTPSMGNDTLTTSVSGMVAEMATSLYDRYSKLDNQALAKVAQTLVHTAYQGAQIYNAVARPGPSRLALL